MNPLNLCQYSSGVAVVDTYNEILFLLLTFVLLLLSKRKIDHLPFQQILSLIY